ncbi:hypothetical protein KY285_031992 [Solanum tuberosum]|nr:hypothetical protein KY284_030540 [Solanum tuberosum]KAH0657110.1 hypothetical protein KY285_031992 [Solanum tuberosum]
MPYGGGIEFCPWTRLYCPPYKCKEGISFCISGNDKGWIFYPGREKIFDAVGNDVKPDLGIGRVAMWRRKFKLMEVSVF